jgi:hypothetical protein
MTIAHILYADVPALGGLQAQLTDSSTTSPSAPWPDGAAHWLALEQQLAQQGHVLDVSETGASLRHATVRAKLARKLCVRATGHLVLEDVASLRSKLLGLASMTDYVNQRVQQGLRASDDFQQLELTITAQSAALKEEFDRSARQAGQQRLREMEAERDAQLAQSTVFHTVDAASAEKLAGWMGAHLGDVLRLSLYPSVDLPDEALVGCLGREHCVGGVEAMFFAHGARPSCEWTLLALLAEIPPPPAADGQSTGFDPTKEFEAPDLNHSQALAQTQGSLLQDIEQLDRLARGYRYPRLMVQPLLLYRSFSGT